MYHIGSRARHNIASNNGKYQFYTETVTPFMDDFLNGRGIVMKTQQEIRREIKDAPKDNNKPLGK